MEFNENLFYGSLVKGNLHAAMGHAGCCPDQAERYGRYVSLFEKEQYLSYGAEQELEELLRIYQIYFRELFYLSMSKEQALERMKRRFAVCLEINAEETDFGELEETYIAPRFRDRGYHFLGGRTGGWYGPYIWKETECRTYEVELPDGIQAYTVNLLDGFLMKSWLDYLSFGEVSTGGWSNGDGMINCVKASYDLESENFQVSLLKHEAQHAMDLAKYKDMTSEDLEYRAKLVELIFSRERNLLPDFVRQADSGQAGNGHAMAAYRIAVEYAARYPEKNLGELICQEIQHTARELFSQSGM